MVSGPKASPIDVIECKSKGGASASHDNAYLLDFLGKGDGLGNLGKFGNNCGHGELDTTTKVMWVESSSNNGEALLGDLTSKNGGARWTWREKDISVLWCRCRNH
jgi:hypothetical protein